MLPPAPTSAFRNIWRLAWPQTLMMFFHFWIGFVDVYVAGKLSTDVQASLGVITQSLFFLLIVAMALANGAVAAVSQSLGGGLTLRARRYVVMSLGLVLLAGLLLLATGFPIKGLLLDLLRVPEEIRPVASYFLDVYLLLLPFYYLFIIGNAVFRAQQQVFIPLAAMIVVTSVNTLGDFGLGLGLWGLPELGYKGLAWTTFGAVVCGAGVDLAVLWRRGWLDLSGLPPVRWIRKGLPYLVSVAWPAGLMQILWHSGYLVLFALTASLPHENITALAALTAGLRLESILFLPAFAFNMTASILVGHALGGGGEEEAYRYGMRIWSMGCILLTLLAGALWAWIEPLAGVLAASPEVQAETARYLRYNFLAIPFTVTSMVLGGALNGAGATRMNMKIIGGTVWGLRLPLAFVLGHLVLGRATGIWMAMLISQAVQALAMFAAFRSRRWVRFSLAASKRNKTTTGVRHAAHLPSPGTEKTN
ncbi:MAG: MATE family efflux transporter [Desulfohalobiaceae bacterium]